MSIRFFLSVITILALFLLGSICQGELSDEKQIYSAMEDLKNDFINQDIDGLLEHYSASQKHENIR